MKITVGKNAVCGKILIPAGDYMVSLNSEAGEFLLTGRGMDLKVPATRRRVGGSGKQQRITTVSFYCGGGAMWSLVVATPKQGEWIAMLELVGDNHD